MDTVLEQSLLVGEQAVDVALQLGRVGPQLEAELAFIHHFP